MTIEWLVPIIVKSLLDEGKSMFFAGFYQRGRWLAQMVVGIVKVKAEGHCNWQDHTHAWCDASIESALRDFSITQADYEWLKGRVGE